MTENEARFSTLGRYAPHIFEIFHRKLRKFIDGLRGNIRRYVATCDPKTFTQALRMTHLAERENDRFMAEQKNTSKRPWSAPTPHKKDKLVRRIGQF